MHLRSNRHSCVLLGVFNHHRDALESCKRLRQLHIGRSAAIHKTRDGHVEVENATTWHGMLWGQYSGFWGEYWLGWLLLGMKDFPSECSGPSSSSWLPLLAQFSG